jgi:hypothetical protein
MSFLLLGVSVAQLCTSILMVLNADIAMLSAKPPLKDIYYVSCQQWDRWFIRALGALSRYVSINVLNSNSTLCLCPGPLTERGGRWARLRGAVQWLGPLVVTRYLRLVRRCRPHCLCYAYAFPHFFLSWRYQLHTLSCPCVPGFLRLAHLPIWWLESHTHCYTICAHSDHTFYAFMK